MNLYLIRGLPGSGKSTFAKNLASALQAHHFEADNYFEDKEGNYVWVADLVHRAHRWCELMTKASMAEGETVVVSNTFTTEKELKPYLALAGEYGYTVTSVIVENRHGNVSVHDVPDETMNRMKNRFSVKL